ncbi:hypothetical protein [Flavobacterium granuli]|uniref:Uncharacterized protein n=1 Tax=Flavobacterium granuli TaxID=280093 RepID=A0ABU1RX85_9FLAO|nr:hypothetical protein [Flavobacterium granuli]MDR6843367.1 hypothetical protein [Flavobacterium granuli]
MSKSLSLFLFGNYKGGERTFSLANYWYLFDLDCGVACGGPSFVRMTILWGMDCGDCCASSLSLCPSFVRMTILWGMDCGVATPVRYRSCLLSSGGQYWGCGLRK